MNHLFSFIRILYVIELIIFLCHYSYMIKKDRSLSAILIVRTMYILIYTIVPIIVLNTVISGNIDNKIKYLNLNDEGILQIENMCFFSFCGYFALELGFSIKKRLVVGHKKKTSYIDNRALSKAAIVMTIVSGFALLLWTYPFGGPIKMFAYGTVIRSGHEIEGINNSFGFMKQFVPLAQFASIIYLGLLKKFKNPRFFWGFIVSGIISFFYLIANDGRAPFLMYLISIFIFVYLLNSKEDVKIRVLPLFIIGIAGFLFIENLDNILSLFRGTSGIESNDNTGISKFIYDEFSWTVRSGQAVQEAMKVKKDIFRIDKEILSGIYGWIPSRFRPSWLPRLEKINTTYWYAGSYEYGGQPPDIIVTGLYCFGYAGIVILPFLYGFIVRQFHYFFSKSDRTLYHNVLFVQLIYQFAKTVAYTDFALVTLNLFYIVFGHLLVVYFNRNYKKLKISGDDS